MKLIDKVAVITGASQGIGFAAAKIFVQEGAKIVLCDIQKDKLDKACAELAALGECMALPVDISNKEQVQQAVSIIMQKHRRIDILVNNAGITQDAQFYKMTAEQFEMVIRVNLFGTFYFSKAVVPIMMERKKGKIIHVSSVSAYNGNFGQTNYAASKAAIIGMTRVMGKELGKYGINVNAVAPGSIMTEMYDSVPEEYKQQKLKSIPMKRFGLPEEVGKLFVFLGSDDSDYITAQVLTIDGGFN